MRHENDKTKIMGSPDSAVPSKPPKTSHRLFQAGFDARKLVLHVARGEQAEAKILIQNNINLLLKKEPVTDYSGRTFSQVSAFQYALWARDWRMWRMMLEVLQENGSTDGGYEQAEEVRKVLLDQFGEVKNIGLTYTLDDEDETEIKNESHFSFEPLLNALKTYTEHFKAWTWSQRAEYWSKYVGIEQRNLPAHVAQEYCQTGRLFYTKPSFKEVEFHRIFIIYNWISEKYEPWFPLQEGVGLGYDFAIYNGAADGGDPMDTPAAAGQIGDPTDINLTALSSLFEVRVNDVAELGEMLRVPLHQLYQNNI